ncbi:MAG: hypothetical protein J4400_03340 [Candidatus Aenigmarchaeota archaeon]|nr:hypothetical protein [Candidatus Aenigmarchaeota archaeon]
MEIKLSEKLRFPVKTIIPSVDINQLDNFSAFSAVRLAKRQFENSGFAVYEGGDFEDNFSLFFYENEKPFCDEYIKVKIGKSCTTDAKKEYCNDICSVVPEPDIRLLLALCRFCSYTGDPGFPDLVLMKSGKWNLVYVLFDELSLSQKMFLLLSRLAGLDIKIVRLDMEEKEEKLEVDLFALFNSVLGERRAKNIMDGLEENIRDAESRASSAQWEDEMNYLLDEKSKNPLFLFKKWKLQGFAPASELKGAIHFVMAHSRNDFEKYLDQLKDDATFMLIAGKTEEAMKRRAEYMQKKFGIGRSRSRLLLNFF